MKVFVISLEDLILSKLVWIQEFQSNIQMEDIKNLFVNKDIDFVYVHYWIEELKLNTFNLMQDTPEHIKQLQLDIWMSKPMSERLGQIILDNDALFQFWKEAKKQLLPNSNINAELFGYNLHTKK